MLLDQFYTPRHIHKQSPGLGFFVYNFDAGSLADGNATYQAMVTIPATQQRIASASFGIKTPQGGGRSRSRDVQPPQEN